MSRIKAGMQDNRIKRLLSAMVVIMMIFAVVRCSFGVIAATGSIDVLITNEGKAVKNITVIEGDKDTLTAVRPSGVDACAYQWQVRLEDKIWVDVNEQTAEAIEVSDALLASVLDSSRTAYVRCKITAAGVEYVSDACKVSIAVRVEESDDIAAASSGVTQTDTEAVTETQASTENSTTEAAAEEAVATPTDAPKKGGVRKSARRAPSNSTESSVTVLSDDDIAPISDDENIVYVTINYLDALTHESIFSSYRASLEKGGDFNQGAIISPAYVGYAAYYMPSHTSERDTEETFTVDASSGEKTAIDPSSNNNWSSADQIAPIFTSVEENKVINVYYFATEVTFQAKFFFQNINDDQYTENESFRNKGKEKTGTIIDDDKLIAGIDNFEEASKGFTKLYHYPEAVAADGSTVFQCYFDRNYYLIRFDLDGGHGVEPIYAKYGASFVVNKPTKYGYTFQGWNLVDSATGEGDGTVDVMPSTIPDGNRVYKAIWTQDKANYAVVYWTENADAADDGDSGYSYWGSRTCTGLSGEKVNASKLSDNATYPRDANFTDYQYFTYNESKTVDESSDVTISGDGSTVINVYYSRNKYTMRMFVARTNATDVTVAADGLSYSPKDTTKENSNITWYVVGGSTHVFGQQNLDNTSAANIQTKLQAVTSWGASAEPQLNEWGKQHYTKHYVVYGNYVYMYIDMEAKYNSDISGIWPYNAFDKLEINGGNGYTKGGVTYKYAYFSAWNVEYKTKYAANNSDNLTLKGGYQRLDAQMLYRDGEDMETLNTKQNKLVVFLAFWENGNDTGWSVPREWNYFNYVPVLPGESSTAVIDGKTYDGVTYNGVTYKLHSLYTLYDNNTDTSTGDTNQTATGLRGFGNPKRSGSTNSDTAEGLKSYNMNFYYERLSYTFQFRSNGVFTEEFLVPYETNMSTYNSDSAETVTYNTEDDSTLQNTDSGKTFQEYFAEPDYPEKLEDNAYRFAGWYTTPQHLAGTEVTADTWKNYTMPANGMVLYAKWEKVEHKVNMFKTYNDMVAYEEELAKLTNPTDEDIKALLAKHNFYKTADIVHGNTVGSVANPTYSYVSDKGDSVELTFGGWFYMENNSPKAFTPLDMPVNRDMNVYADWGSLLPQPYTIHYVLKETADSATTAALDAIAEAPVENKTYELTGSDGKTTSYLYVNGGYHRYVAKDTTGYGYQGSTRTFTAKAGDPYNQLYSDYNKGYYPTVASHSITMDYEEDKTEAQNNIYTFYYVYAANVSYKVRYLESETGTVLYAEKKASSTSAVVTERFQVIDGYLPDAFYKRLVLAVVEDPAHPGTYIGSDENVVTFYYSENDSAAYYAVHFMLQKIDATNTEGGGTTDKFSTVTGKYTGPNYTESDYMIEGIANIENGEGKVDITPYEFSGFAVEDGGIYVDKNESSDGTVSYEAKTLSEQTGTNEYTFTLTVSENGTDIYIFYTRQSYDYKVYYLKAGTDISGDKLDSYGTQTDDNNTTVLKDAKEEKNVKYGTEVTEKAADIDGYACSSASTQTITVSSDNSHNYIIFYYITEQYTIQYKIAGETGGKLSKQNKTFLGASKNEPDFDITSTATADEGYKFDGWYLDEACTKPAGDTYADSEGGEHVYATISDDTFTITPKISELFPSTSKNTNVFYAKFVRQLGSLTISRTGATGGNQVFTYELTNKSTGEKITVTVAAEADGSGRTTIKNLPYGTYEVKEVGDWSWRYGDNSIEATISDSDKALTAAFSGGVQNDKWLSGNSGVKTNAFASSYTPPKSSSLQSDETGAELN